jgi:hypothetical protein
MDGAKSYSTDASPERTNHRALLGAEGEPVLYMPMVEAAPPGPRWTGSALSHAWISASDWMLHDHSRIGIVTTSEASGIAAEAWGTPASGRSHTATARQTGTQRDCMLDGPEPQERCCRTGIHHATCWNDPTRIAEDCMLAGAERPTGTAGRCNS